MSYLLSVASLFISHWPILVPRRLPVSTKNRDLLVGPTPKFCIQQRLQFLVLIKRSAAPGDENVIDPLGHNTYMYDKVSQYNTLTSPPVTSVLRNPASCATFFFSFSILTLNDWNKSKQHQNLGSLISHEKKTKGKHSLASQVMFSFTCSVQHKFTGLLGKFTARLLTL